MLCEKELMGGKGVTERGGLWSPEEGAWRRKERSPHLDVVVWIITSMAEQYCTVWLIPLLYIHSSIDGHLRYFYLVAVVNCAAMNICIQAFARLSIFNSLG